MYSMMLGTENAHLNSDEINTKKKTELERVALA